MALLDVALLLSLPPRNCRVLNSASRWADGQEDCPGQLTLTSYSSPLAHSTMPTNDEDCSKAFSSYLLTLTAKEVPEKKLLPAHLCTVAKEVPLSKKFYLGQ